MNDSKELKGLYEQLRSIVQKINDKEIEEFRPDETPALITDFVVITATTTIADDGEELSTVGLCLPAHSTPVYRMVGLVECAKIRLAAVVSTDE